MRTLMTIAIIAVTAVLSALITYGVATHQQPEKVSQEVLKQYKDADLLLLEEGVAQELLNRKLYFLTQHEKAQVILKSKYNK